MLAERGWVAATMTLVVLGLSSCAPRTTETNSRARSADPANMSSQRMPYVSPELAFDIATEAVAESYVISRMLASQRTFFTQPMLGVARNTGYVGDFIAPEQVNARRTATVLVEPSGEGSVVRVAVRLERQADAELRANQQSTEFGDRPGNTPAERGEYATPQQQTTWRDGGRDQNEERRLLALIAGRANQRLRQATTQPTAQTDRADTTTSEETVQVITAQDATE